MKRGAFQQIVAKEVARDFSETPQKNADVSISFSIEKKIAENELLLENKKVN